MTRFTVSEGREKFSEAIQTAQSETVVFERSGEDVVVMISVARYEALMDAMEELEDIAAFDASLAEDAPAIPWDLVKRDLGWS
jgi:PHD/YefM family antitoxin component YafN of YafNO toxin-antitoxin module